VETCGSLNGVGGQFSIVCGGCMAIDRPNTGDYVGGFGAVSAGMCLSISYMDGYSVWFVVATQSSRSQAEKFNDMRKGRPPVVTGSLMAAYATEARMKLTEARRMIVNMPSSNNPLDYERELRRLLDALSAVDGSLDEIDRILLANGIVPGATTDPVKVLESVLDRVREAGHD